VRTHQKIIISAHYIWHGYGHWAPNCIRGSGSTEIRKPELEALGEIHFGRKTDQPTREELKAFYREVNKRLKYKAVWFEDAKRQALGDAFGKVCAERRYTCWAFAAMWNHVHAVIRRHRDNADAIWHHCADGMRAAIRSFGNVDPAHPVWSERPYKVFLYVRDEVTGRIEYVEENPEKEKPPRQSWPFVLPYDGWPHTPR
jgi:hypothetical protein